jgi:hypothetical protein
VIDKKIKNVFKVKIAQTMVLLLRISGLIPLGHQSDIQQKNWGGGFRFPTAPSKNLQLTKILIL